MNTGNKRPSTAKHNTKEPNELPPEDESKGVMGISLHVQTLQLNEHELSPDRSPSLRPKNKFTIVESNQQSEPAGIPDADDKNISFGVEVTKSPQRKQKPKKPMTLQEAAYYNRETARTEKEANRTEKVLLKELKRLGVKVSNFDADILSPERVKV